MHALHGGARSEGCGWRTFRSTVDAVGDIAHRADTMSISRQALFIRLKLLRNIAVELLHPACRIIRAKTALS